MKKQLIIFGIIVLLVCVGLSGCTNTNNPTEQKVTTASQDKFLGTWSGYNADTDQYGSTTKSYYYTMTFNSLGVVHYEYEGGSNATYQYRVEGDRLYIDYGDPSVGSDINSYAFTNDYKSLTLTLLNSGDPKVTFMSYFVKQNNTENHNMKPTASCSANHTSGNAPLVVQFTGSGTDTDGTIVSYYWNFGDGTSSTSIQQNISHTFTNAGSYTVTLTVTDDDGATASDTIFISAIFPEPVIIEDTSYSYSDNYVNVDGVIRNVANVQIQYVEFKVTLYDKSGNVIKTNQKWNDILESYTYCYAMPLYIEPEETAFFSVTFEDVPYYDHYGFEIISFHTDYPGDCSEGLVMSNIKDNIDTVLGYEVTGTVKNEGSSKRTGVTVWGAFYDSYGKLLCVDFGSVSSSNLYSGQEEEFTITVYNWYIDPNKISTYDLKINGYS